MEGKRVAGWQKSHTCGRETVTEAKFMKRKRPAINSAKAGRKGDTKCARIHTGEHGGISSWFHSGVVRVQNSERNGLARMTRAVKFSKNIRGDSGVARKSGVVIDSGRQRKSIILNIVVDVIDVVPESVDGIKNWGKSRVRGWKNTHLA